MVGNTGINRNSKKTKLTKSRKEEEVVESHYGLYLDGTWHIEEEYLLLVNQYLSKKKLY